MMNESYPENEDKLEGIIKPPIYFKSAIWGFSVFFSSLFGGILLMLNLKSIGKRKEANFVLVLSILMTVLTIVIVTVFEIQNRLVSLFCNIAGGAILAEFFHRKYFPDEADYERKKIWKPLIIGILILAGLILLMFVAQDQAV